MILLLLLIRAGHEGFEPTNAGVRVQCLTAWRVPINILCLENRMYYTLFYLICQGLFLIFSKKGLAALFSTAAWQRSENNGVCDPAENEYHIFSPYNSVSNRQSRFPSHRNHSLHSPENCRQTAVSIP